MRILIYGGGAVGLGMASCLLQAGSAVTILTKKTTAQVLQSQGLRRTGIFGSLHFFQNRFQCYTASREITGPLYDFILICTKSYDVAAAAEDLRHSRQLWNENTLLVLFQNGWGHEEHFLNFYSKDNIFHARVMTGFYRHENNRVEITAHGQPIHIGSLWNAREARVQPLCAAIDEGGVPCEKTEHIEEDLWAKMLFNCFLNPLGAIFNVPYGILGENAETRILQQSITEEIFLVMAAAGFKTHWLRTEDYLQFYYQELFDATAKHESSMLQDIRAGRQTEIEVLNGAVVRLGEKHRVAVPCNQAVYQMLKFLERRSLYGKNAVK